MWPRCARTCTRTQTHMYMRVNTTHDSSGPLAPLRQKLVLARALRISDFTRKPSLGVHKNYMCAPLSKSLRLCWGEHNTLLNKPHTRLPTPLCRKANITEPFFFNTDTQQYGDTPKPCQFPPRGFRHSPHCIPHTTEIVAGAPVSTATCQHRTSEDT